MNGLEFFHRALRPWARDPAFYLSILRGDLPKVHGALPVPRKFPIPAEQIAEFRVKLKAIPKVLKQAKGNLTEGAEDLAIIGMRKKEQEIDIFSRLLPQLAEHNPDLVPDAKRALAAVEDFLDWLKENKSKMTAPAGLGKENYNWWLKNVHLFPYTWDECWDIVQGEYERAISTLKLEENRNRKLPKLEPVATEAEFRRRHYEAQQYLLKFLREEEILTVPDYLVPTDPRSWGVERDFFQQCYLREPLPEQTHGFIGHHFDGLRSQRDNRLIQGGRDAFDTSNINHIEMIRSEGFALALEELLMHAGLFDKRPQRRKDVLYIMAVFRAVRAAADLKMHSNEFTLRDAMRDCVERTPYGWTLKDGHEVWWEMETTLRVPGWHIGMVVGKIQFMKLLADRAEQLGDKFNLRQFMDEFLAAGMIPMALTRWEMTGLTDEIEKLW
jgi:hypothetical protein